MRKIKITLLLAVMIMSVNALGQIQTNQNNGSVSDKVNRDKGDTLLTVVYAKRIHDVNKAAFFINGKFFLGSLLGTIDPSQIDSLYVVKDNIKIDGFTYSGQVYIRTKKTYTPRFISLNALKEKHTDLKKMSTVYMIDGDIINGDYDRYMVDENYILRIIVDRIENAKDKIDLVVIKLLTKSAQNINKSKEIRIRGEADLY